MDVLAQKCTTSNFNHAFKEKKFNYISEKKNSLISNPKLRFKKTLKISSSNKNHLLSFLTIKVSSKCASLSPSFHLFPPQSNPFTYMSESIHSKFLNRFGLNPNLKFVSNSSVFPSQNSFQTISTHFSYLNNFQNHINLLISASSSSLLLSPLSPLSSSSSSSSSFPTSPTRSSAKKSFPPFSKPILHLCMKSILIAFMICITLCMVPPVSLASDTSIGSSSMGYKLASYFRRSGLSDEFIVASIASLPVLELRASIPIGYWMNLHPVKTTILSIIGNMLPVPLILLFLGPLSDGISKRSRHGKQAFETLFEFTRKKTDPIEEFKWIGLMLFVAIPLPGTGAWSGAIASYLLQLPFWASMTANFFGVVLAALAMNFLCCLPLIWAVTAIFGMIILSSVVWNVLRYFQS